MFRALLERLVRPPEDIRAEQLRQWISAIPGAIPIAATKPRSRCRVAGVVRNIRIDPREGRGCIDATIADGTGSLVVRWLGRSSLQGIRLGVGLVVEGIQGEDPDGRPVVLNPEYDLVPGPEQG
jgi:hypothetical protein